MTIFGFLLIVAGAIVGLWGTTAYDGRWVLGLIIAGVGVAFVFLDAKDDPA